MQLEVSARRGRFRRNLPSAALVALGLAALYQASSLPFGTIRQPETGFFPTLVATALVLFAALAMARGEDLPAAGYAAERGAPLRVWTVIFAVGAYAALLSRAGFILCTAALVLALLRGVGRVSWAASLAIAVVASVCCYLLFTRLGMPLPAGLLGY